MNGDIEKAAQKLYFDAGFSTSEQADPWELVRRVLGPDAIRMVPSRALPGLGAVARVRGQWSVFLVEGAPLVAQRFVLLHELAHVHLGRGAGEARCDALAAALLVPGEALNAAVRRVGLRLPTLARGFGASESCVGLRLGEVTRKPTALVSRQSVRFRGAQHPWPAEPELRRIAEGPKQPGIRKAKLRDASERILLTAG